MSKNNIKISACIITYNQEEYIAECLEGAIKQESGYSYEIVISDDKSTDNTLAICKDYARRYPELIRIIDSSENLGVALNFFNTVSNCHGEYIAICEGDDFWTDPLKLKKQIDVLESNSNCSACFTNADIIEGDSLVKKYLNYSGDKIFNTDELILADAGLFPTASIVFRKYRNYPEFLKKYNSADRAWSLFLAHKGSFFLLNQITCVYRVHSTGVMSSIRNDRFKKIDFLIKNFNLLNDFNQFSSKMHLIAINSFKSKLSLKILLYSDRHTMGKDWIKFVKNLSGRQWLTFIKYKLKQKFV